MGKAFLPWLFLLATVNVQAGLLPDRAQIDGWLKGLGSDNQFDASKGIDWGVMPGPFYTPELGLGLGAAVVGMYRPDAADSVSQNSTLSLTGFVSSTGAFGAGFENYSFFAQDRWRFYLNGSLKNMPTYYWGDGYGAGKNDNHKQEYTSKEFALAPTVLRRLAADTYFGLGWSLSAQDAASVKDVWKGNFQRAPGGTSVFSSGASATLSYDTRDFVPNPSRGQVADLTYTHYSPDLGGDDRFDVLESRYGLYYPFNDKTVLAWDLYGRFTQGDVPWNMMSLLGNDQRMRGYYEGRYRDRDAVSTQLEYRRKLDWRHGFVAWLGTGTLAHRSGDLGKGAWLPSVGAGYRFEFKPRMNVRLDFGVGKSSSGFYFQVGEAF